MLLGSQIDGKEIEQQRRQSDLCHYGYVNHFYLLTSVWCSL